MSKNRNPDEVDRKILSALASDARASLVEIGERVSLSPPAVKRRIDRLEAEGTIRGYCAVVDQAALGWTTEAFLEVFCEGDTSLPALRRALVDHPEVVGAYTVAGDPEAILHVRTRDIPHLERTIERIHSQPNVVRTRTQVVLTSLVERPLTAPARRR
ncbi:MAG TPA: Lrp/AsnC family transcriptional regulator [Thermoleophilaceae bacterium]|jgi:DNA-binding Lrp family transcriptional regulator